MNWMQYHIVVPILKFLCATQIEQEMSSHRQCWSLIGNLLWLQGRKLVCLKFVWLIDLVLSEVTLLDITCYFVWYSNMCSAWNMDMTHTGMYTHTPKQAHTTRARTHTNNISMSYSNFAVSSVLAVCPCPCSMSVFST